MEPGGGRGGEPGGRPEKDVDPPPVGAEGRAGHGDIGVPVAIEVAHHPQAQAEVAALGEALGPPAGEAVDRVDLDGVARAGVVHLDHEAARGQAQGGGKGLAVGVPGGEAVDGPAVAAGVEQVERGPAAAQGPVALDRDAQLEGAGAGRGGGHRPALGQGGALALPPLGERAVLALQAGDAGAQGVEGRGAGAGAGRALGQGGGLAGAAERGGAQAQAPPEVGAAARPAHGQRCDLGLPDAVFEADGLGLSGDAPADLGLPRLAPIGGRGGGRGRRDVGLGGAGGEGGGAEPEGAGEQATGHRDLRAGAAPSRPSSMADRRRSRSKTTCSR